MEGRRKEKISRTRKAINQFREGLNDKSSKLLETNLFSKQTTNQKELEKYNQNTKPFEFMFENIRPKLIYVHGSKARKYFEKRYGKELVKEKFKEIHDLKLKYKYTIYVSNHLSRMAFEKVKDIGKDFKETLIYK